MAITSALASGDGAHDPLSTALVMVSGGCFFCLVGIILVTNYRGLARKWVQANDESLEQIPMISKPVRRFNVRVFFAGDEARFADHKLNVMPKVAGSAFVVIGAVALIAGIVRLILLA